MSGRRLIWKLEFLLKRWWRPSEIRWRRRYKRAGLSESNAWFALYGNHFLRTGNVEVLDYWYSDKGHLLGWARAVELLRAEPPECVWTD